MQQHDADQSVSERHERAVGRPWPWLVQERYHFVTAHKSRLGVNMPLGTSPRIVKDVSEEIARCLLRFAVRVGYNLVVEVPAKRVMVKPDEAVGCERASDNWVVEVGGWWDVCQGTVVVVSVGEYGLEDVVLSDERVDYRWRNGRRGAREGLSLEAGGRTVCGSSCIILEYSRLFWGGGVRETGGSVGGSYSYMGGGSRSSAFVDLGADVIRIDVVLSMFSRIAKAIDACWIVSVSVYKMMPCVLSVGQRRTEPAGREVIKARAGKISWDEGWKVRGWKNESLTVAVASMEHPEAGVRRADMRMCAYQGRVDEWYLGKIIDYHYKQGSVRSLFLDVSRSESMQYRFQTSSMSGGHALCDIKPIYDEEPKDEVQTTAEINIFATRQQHTEQPEFNNEGEVDQNAEQCHDTCPLPANVNDNQTTELTNQSLEFENICLKKTVAQFQKDFLRMEAHCVNLKLKYQNQALKEGQHGQFLKEKSNEAKVKHEIDVIETINIELEHKVAKLLKENKTLKRHYKELSDSIEQRELMTYNQITSLICQIR
ncbi:hypothetical protein Tco_0099834 [Tanacetum coccineum]